MNCFVLSKERILLFKKENSTFKNKYNKSVFIVLLVSLGLMYLISKIIFLSDDKRIVIFSVLSLIIITMLDGYIYYLIRSFKEKEYDNDRVVYQQQAGVYANHVKEMEELLNDVQKERHDMKQHIYVVSEMIRCKQYIEAQEYLKKLSERDAINKEFISKTGNILIDSIINVKYAVMRQNGIKLQLDIHIPRQLPFEEDDLSVMVGNVIDNAIEAVKLLPIQERFIGLYIRYEKNVFIMTVVNPFDHELLKNEEGELITSKGDNKKHGIGLKSIKKVTQKYSGSVVIETDDGKFVVKMILVDRQKDYIKARKNYM